MTISTKQQKILEFVELFTQDKGYPPTIREIGRAAGISSTSVVNYNLEILEREGLINRGRTISRGIRLTKETPEPISPAIFNPMRKIPLLGRIAAGQPIPVPDGAFDGESEGIELAHDLVPDGNDFYALKVQGYSMIDALINDGDVVVMRHTNTAENGEMVAAWLLDQEETTLKRFFHEGDRVRLQPENKTMQPIYVPSDKVEIQGRVVAVIRQIN